MGVLMMMMLLWIALAIPAAQAATVAYTNATPITTPIGAVGLQPYPSPIQVSGLAGELTSVAVTLVNVTHPNPDDLDVLLVGPQGQKVLLMSDAGGTGNITNLTFTITDNVRVSFPDAGPLTSGSYRPSNFDTTTVDSFPNAPAPPYAGNFAEFVGANPNGDWRLFVVDDVSTFNSGSISGGWRLLLVTTNRPPVVTQPLVDQSVPAGANVTFQVGVEGSPPLSFQWLRENTVIVPFGQGTDTLRLTGVQAAQSGLYTVQIINGATPTAPVTSQARLTVFSPLQITKPLPAQIQTQPGGVITLSVEATGTPPLRYQWLRNGMILSNATDSVLRLVDVSPLDAGRYGVVVWNPFQSARSGPTLVRIPFESAPPPKDLFQDRPRISEPGGITQGDNSEAGIEPDEPAEDAARSRTMWMEFVPDQGGVLTVRTRGSGLDTRLAAFSGEDLRDLKLITKDDDSAGFYASEIQFNVLRGRAYQIQLDGFGRDQRGGPFTLSWDLEATQARVPVIISNPTPRISIDGAPVTFEVLTEPGNLEYQWYFLAPPYDKPVLVRDAKGPTLTLDKPGRRDVGFYYPVIRNDFDRIIFGPAVALQLGNMPSFVADKVNYMFLSGSPSAGFISIGLGNSVHAATPSAANREIDDPDPCDSPFFGTLWQGLTATNSGVIQVETTGSDIGARLAIYQLTGSIDDFSKPPLICDLTSASNGLPAIARFDAIKGTNYTIVVEGFEGSGTLEITSKMGIAPPLTNTLMYRLVAAGGGITLQSPASAWCPLPSCQWLFNGTPIPGATNSSLTVANFAAPAIGTYSIQVSNFVRATTRDVAFLDLAPPFELHEGFVPDGAKSRFEITASNAFPFVLQTTTNLGSPWTPVATNPDPSLVLRYTNGSVVLDPQRFYRAVPWSP